MAATGGEAARHRPRFTNRAAVMVLVLAVLVVSYASSLRAWLTQREQIREARSQIAKSERNIKALEREKKRWHDPAYVEAQGRSVLGWVLPGEVAYQVIGRDGKPLASSRSLPDADQVVPEEKVPWWVGAYQTVRVADHPERVPTPLRKIPRTTNE